MREKLRVVLYTKPDCGLCRKMKAVMRDAGCDELYMLEEVDIEQDPGLFELYRYEIPVLFIDGVEAFRHRLTADEFKTYVTSLFGRA